MTHMAQGKAFQLQDQKSVVLWGSRVLLGGRNRTAMGNAFLRKEDALLPCVVSKQPEQRAIVVLVLFAYVFASKWLGCASTQQPSDPPAE